MTILTPKVFDFVEEYVDELESRDELPADLDEEESLVLFTREFFAQFASDVLGYEVLAFDSAAAVDVAVAYKKRPTPEPSIDTIVAAFRAFCQDYATIIGEHYDRGGERSAFQREFVPTLLDDIFKWADGDGARSDIADAAAHALGIITEALEAVADPE
jgi:hypothetical protein